MRRWRKLLKEDFYTASTAPAKLLPGTVSLGPSELFPLLQRGLKREVTQLLAARHLARCSTMTCPPALLQGVNWKPPPPGRTFRRLSQTDVGRILDAAKLTTGLLGPSPLWLVKASDEGVQGPLVDIINLSLCSRVYPEVAILLLRNPSLDPSDLSQSQIYRFWVR